MFYFQLFVLMNLYMRFCSLAGCLDMKLLSLFILYILYIVDI